MGLLDEAVKHQDTPLDAALQAGIEVLSLGQQITFTQYVRIVLPLDGFVFWVRSDLVNNPALLNAFKFNVTTFRNLGGIVKPAPTLTIKGSFHYATDLSQDETENSTTNRVILTSETEIQDLNAVGPNVMYVGMFDGVSFAFSQRGMFYRQADIYHYVGYAVKAKHSNQFIDNPRVLNTGQIVSNSLPIWLSMNSELALWFEDFENAAFPLFPSYLAPQNESPPFASVHIEPSGTHALTSAPSLDTSLSHTQLCKDTVRITLYGLNNDAALSFIDFVNQFSLNYDTIGIMNIPVMRDEKRPQAEFGILAMVKSVEFEVSYYQNVARNAARQLIKQAFVTYTPN